MSYYLAIKRYEVLRRTTVGMNFGDILLSEGSQSQETTYCLIPLTGNIHNRPVYRDGR